MKYINQGQRKLLPRLTLLGGVLALPLAGCDTAGLLEVNDPDIVTPISLEGEVGRAAIYAGAVGDFTLAYDGGAGGGSFLDGYVTSSALLSDEAYASGTFPTRQEFDQRSIDTRNGTLEDLFERLQRARRATEVGAEVLSEADPEDPRAAELLALAGYTYTALGEGFCSGIPFSTAPLVGELEFGDPLTTTEVFNVALERFRAAEAAAAGEESLVNLAKVGRARALLNLGDYAAAADAVAGVPTGYFYGLPHSIASGRQENGFFAGNTLSLRVSIADDQGGSGPPYRDGSNDGEGLSYLSANDPRIPYEAVNDAFDATVDTTYLLLEYAGYDIPLSRTAPGPLATGLQARLIEAEAAFHESGPAAALQILNDLRANSGLDLEPLEGPATVDMIFRERAFWLYATGHRLGDMRRLIRQYGRAPSEVFPVGNYFKGGTFGDDVNFPIPQTELNNPLASEGCINRNA